MKRIALVLLALSTMTTFAQQAKPIKPATARSKSASSRDWDIVVAILSPLLSDAHMAVVDDCHVLKLDYEQSGEISHSSAFSCYRTTHPLHEALVPAA